MARPPDDFNPNAVTASTTSTVLSALPAPLCPDPPGSRWAPLTTAHVTTLGWITSTIEVGGSRTGRSSLSMASTGPARLTRSRDSDADAPAAPRRSDPPGSRWALTRSPMPPRSVGVTMGSGNVRLLLNVTTLGWITSTLEVAGSRIGGTSLSMASAGSPDSRPRPRLGRNQKISRLQARQPLPAVGHLASTRRVRPPATA